MRSACLPIKRTPWFCSTMKGCYTCIFEKRNRSGGREWNKEIMYWRSLANSVSSLPLILYSSAEADSNTKAVGVSCQSYWNTRHRASGTKRDNHARTRPDIPACTSVACVILAHLTCNNPLGFKTHAFCTFVVLSGRPCVQIADGSLHERE
jgi:hypothetical protein